jgi:hypothetical protein
MQVERSKPQVKTTLRRICSTAVVFALLFNLFAAAAFAKTSRTALITDVSGDVTVTKGGGSNPIPAFSDMPLNEGDTIETGDDGTATIKIVDPESERIVYPNSKVTVSELSESASGKKSGFKLFIGSIWNKVKSLASGNEDEMETPTATMGVRGTRYLVIANPDGTLSVVVASGLVAAQVSSGILGNSNGVIATKGITTPGTASSTVLIAPTQELNLNPAAPPTNLANAVQIADVTKIVQQANPAIVKAFIIDAPIIAEENRQLLDNLKSTLQNGGKPVLQRGDAVSDLTVQNLDDLNKVAQNMNNLVSSIASNAVKLGKVESTELTQLIEQANGQITNPDAKIDLTNAKPLDPTAGVDPEQAKKKQAEQDRINQLLQQQEQERQRQLEELVKQLGQAVNQAIEQQKNVVKMNQQAQADLVKAAESSYVSGLSDAEKQKFETNKKKLDQQTSTTDSNTSNSNGSGKTKPSAPTSLTMSDTSLTITGMGPAGLNVTVEKLDGSASTTVASGTIADDGNFNLSAAQLLPAGTKLQAYTTRGGLNSDVFTAEVGTGALKVNDMTTSNLVSGMAGVGSKVQVFLGEKSLSDEVSTTLSGTFSITLSQEVYDQKLNVKSTAANGVVQTVTIDAPSKSVSVTAGSVSIAALNPTSTGFNMVVKLKGFTGANAIYGAELHFLSNDFTDHYSTVLPTGTPIRSGGFSGTDSVDMIKTVYGTVDGSPKAETIYTVTNFNTTNNVSYDNDETLVTIPFNVTNSTAGTFTFTLPYVLFVNSTGDPVATASTSDLKVTYTKTGN